MRFCQHPLARAPRRALLAAAVAQAAAAVAQQAPAPASPVPESERPQVSEVTTQKRLHGLQEVPLSVRAVGETEMARSGAHDMQGYAAAVPSLNLIEQGPGRTQIVMRGISTGDLRFDRSEIRETVGSYRDESPISAQIVSPNLGRMEIQRKKVLRGPQGTQYGAGSMSGEIRMITRRLNLSENEGKLDVTLSGARFGGFNKQLAGVFNLPLSLDVMRPIRKRVLGAISATKSLRAI